MVHEETRGGFQNPHIEPSHDEFRQNYRVLTANYHLTPDWRLSDGGHLELWHNGLSSYPTTTLAKFNRLIVIATHRASWHSVSPVDSRRSRCSIFNCYYSPESLVREEYDHLDVFRGRPEQRIRDLWLRGEQHARQFWRKTLSPRLGRRPLSRQLRGVVGISQSVLDAHLAEGLFQEVGIPLVIHNARRIVAADFWHGCRPFCLL